MSKGNNSYSAAEIRARLSISTLVFQGYRPLCEAALEELAEHGICRIELLESPDQYDLGDKRCMRLVDQMCRNCGIEVVAYHAYKTSFEGVESEAQRQERVELCCRQLDTLLELGGKFWCSHAGVAAGAVEKSYAEMGRYIEGTDAVIAVENFNREGVKIKDRVAFLERLDHPQVGMILDIAHEFDEQGVNPMTVAGAPTFILQQCGQRLRHIHLQGYRNGAGHHPPLVEGDEIQWGEIFAGLAAHNYGGEFTFEPAGMLANLETLDYIGRAPERLAALVGNSSD